MKVINAIMVATALIGYVPHALQAQDTAPILEAVNRNPWRISLGYEFRPSVKAKANFLPSRYSAGKPAPASAQYQAQGTALSAASRGDYDNGYVHEDDFTKIDGNTTAWSANDNSQYSSSSETLTFSTYYSVSETALKSPTSASVEEKEDFPGMAFDISRDIWSSGGCKLRAAFGFSYVKSKDMLDFSHAFSLGSSSSSTRMIQDIYDVSYWGGVPPPSLQNKGTPNTGAMIPAKPANSTDVAVGGGTAVNYNGGADFTADFEMAEFRAALEPEISLFDWMALYGQVGLAVGQGKSSWEVSSWFSSNGSRRLVSDSGEEKETFAQGFAGLGLRVMPFENIGVTVFCDCRFGKGELEINADPYNGKIETGAMRYGAALTAAF